MLVLNGEVVKKSLQRHPQGIKDQYLKLTPQRAVTVDYKCTYEVGRAPSLPASLSGSLMSCQEQKRKAKKTVINTHTYMHIHMYMCAQIHTHIPVLLVTQDFKLRSRGLGWIPVCVLVYL